MPFYKLSHKKIHTQLNEFGLVGVNDFCRFVEEKLDSSGREIEEEQARFAEEADKEDEHYRFLYEGKLEGDWDTLGGIHELAGQLAILALNQQVENRTKAILVSHNAKSTTNLRYRSFDQFEARMLEAKGIELLAMAGAHAANEVRLISNSIKHNDGKVSSSLAKKYAHWKEGESIDGLMGVFRDKTKDAGIYLDALVDELVEDNPGG